MLILQPVLGLLVFLPNVVLRPVSCWRVVLLWAFQWVDVQVMIERSSHQCRKRCLHLPGFCLEKLVFFLRYGEGDHMSPGFGTTFMGCSALGFLAK